jgi:fructan beta-fructosidase
VALPKSTIDGTTDLTQHIDFPVSRSRAVLEFQLEGAESHWISVVLSNSKGEEYRVGFDRETNSFFSDRRHAGDHSFSDAFADRVHIAPRETGGEVLQLNLYFDVASVELFADGGATVMTDTFFPTVPFDRIAVESEGGEVVLLGGTITGLRSIW